MPSRGLLSYGRFTAVDATEALYAVAVLSETLCLDPEVVHVIVKSPIVFHSQKPDTEVALSRLQSAPLPPRYGNHKGPPVPLLATPGCWFFSRS
jgi:hypothetical protein